MHTFKETKNALILNYAQIEKIKNNVLLENIFPKGKYIYLQRKRSCNFF